jgi:dihydroorotate dehydrogenase (fumarate)
MRFVHPLMNAAGTVKLVEQATRLAQSPIAALIMGSYTPRPRDGNEGRTYHTGDGFTLNALGMPNPGVAYLADTAAVVKAALGARPLFVSVAGFGLDDYLALVADVPQCVDQVEVNLGCPNVAGERIGSFDLDLIDAILAAVPRRVGLKLSPYSDPGLLAEVAAIVSGRVAFLTLSNTFANGWAPGALSTVYGGVAGAAMKPIVLGQVHQFGRLLPDVPLIATGGFQRGSDWADYSDAGACAVQVASRFLAGDEDPDVFVTLLADLVAAR